MSTPRSLPSDLTILSLRSMHSEWLAALPEQPEILPDAGAPPAAWPVDASRVDEVDAAGVQFLLALSRALAARQHSLDLKAPSQPLLAACAQLGLASLLAGGAEQRS